MWRGQSQCLLSPSFSTLFVEPGSLTEPGADWLDWLVNKSQ